MVNKDDCVKVVCPESLFFNDYGSVISIEGDVIEVELDHTPGAKFQFTKDELEVCKTLNLYNKLLNLRGDPEAFQEAAQEAIDDMVNQISDDTQRRKAKQINWKIQATLRGVPPSQRYNKMVEIFWAGVEEFKNTIGGVK